MKRYLWWRMTKTSGKGSAMLWEKMDITRQRQAAWQMRNASAEQKEKKDQKKDRRKSVSSFWTLICRTVTDFPSADGSGRTYPLFRCCSHGRDLEEDALRGYELGAEDYIPKPFSMKILLKKIALILRRSGKEESSAFEDGYLTVDFERAKITAGGEACRLTPTEFRLLRQFILHPGQLLTYEVLLDRLWDEGGQFVEKHTLAVNVNRLRGKIEQDGRRYISNIYGMGYQWLG